MSGQKTSLNKFKRVKIIPNIFYDHSGMKLEINGRRKTGKLINVWTFKTHSWITNGSIKNIKGKLENTWDKWKWRCDIQNLWNTANIYTKLHTIYIQYTYKYNLHTYIHTNYTQINSTTLHLKNLEKAEGRKWLIRAEQKMNYRIEKSEINICFFENNKMANL